jgi:hypothetical protein
MYMILRHAIAVVAAAGSVASLGLVFAPTEATAAPACEPGYPASVITTTGLSLSRSIGTYGDRNTARIRVASGVGAPDGRVTISGSGFSYALTLHGGRASHALPLNLPGGATYRVTARYAGQGCFRPSSASKSYTVFAARTHIRGLHAGNVRRAHHPFVTGRVTTSNHAPGTGSVRVRISFHGDRAQQRTITLHRGRFSATFGRVYTRGSWTATAVKSPSRSYSGSSASTGFRVR